MAQQNINIGTTANDNTGDSPRAAGGKINSNFTEVYAGLSSKANTTHTHSVADLTATGTRNTTTFLRGDNTWSVPAGGSGGSGPTGTAAPTTGTYAQGDFVRNSAPSEFGTTGAKFIVQGWTCLVSGTPGTWVPNNVFTGN